MPQRLKPGTVKVLSMDFGMTVRDDFASAYQNGDVSVMTKANGNNVYRAGNFLRSNCDKGIDPEFLDETVYEMVKQAGRIILAASDSIEATGKYDHNGTDMEIVWQAGQYIYDYSKRRDDKFIAMETGGAALLASVV